MAIPFWHSISLTTIEGKISNLQLIPVTSCNLLYILINTGN